MEVDNNVVICELLLTATFSGRTPQIANVALTYNEDVFTVRLMVEFRFGLLLSNTVTAQCKDEPSKAKRE